MQGMRPALDKLIDDGHDVTIGVFDRVEPHLPVACNELIEVRRDELTELSRRQEWTGVQAIIGA